MALAAPAHSWRWRRFFCCPSAGRRSRRWRHGGLRVRRRYSTSESLVKATPILLCALAVILPARLGLISVGAEGQLYLGALVGTAVVVNPLAHRWRSGAGHARVSARGRRGLELPRRAFCALVSTSMKPYRRCSSTTSLSCWSSSARLWPVERPGQSGLAGDDPVPAGSLGGTFFGTRVHPGLVFAFVIALRAWCYPRAVGPGTRHPARQRQGRPDDWPVILAANAMMVMALGGAFGGLAGICETAAIQGRLQSGNFGRVRANRVSGRLARRP